MQYGCIPANLYSAPGPSPGGLWAIEIGAAAASVPAAMVQSPEVTSLEALIAPDLSYLEAVKGRGRRAEFQKNRYRKPASDRFALGVQGNVTCITDHSIATGTFSLPSQLAGDLGYSHERLAKGRSALVRVWRERSARLAPRYPQTDILAALLVASEIFREAPQGRQKVLIVLSDMKKATRALNIEHQPVVRTKAAMQKVENTRQLAALDGVHVYIVGVDGAGETVAHWKTLQQSWLAYFARSGATVERYSALSDIPESPLRVGDGQK